MIDRLELMKLLAEEHDWLVDKGVMDERTEKVLDAMTIVNYTTRSKADWKRIAYVLREQMRYDLNQTLQPDNTMHRMGRVIDMHKSIESHIDSIIELQGYELNQECRHNYGLPQTLEGSKGENLILQEFSIDHTPDELPKLTAVYVMTRITVDKV